jgi:hypothetical protein
MILLISISILLCFSIVGSIMFRNYCNTFTIDVDNLDGNNAYEYELKKILKESIESFINKSTITKEDIDINKTHVIGKIRYVLYTSKGFMGDAELLRGPNGKYKVKSAGIAPNYIRYRTGKFYLKGDGIRLKVEYVVTMGKNIDMRIHHLIISTSNSNSIPTVPEEYFILLHPRRDASDEGVSIRAYDKNNVDITDEIYQ